jgi:hypothetical protein
MALRRTVERQCRQYMLTWRVDPLLDSATRDLLSLCRERGTCVALVIFPESTEFRSWYGPGVEQRIQDYLSRLRADFGVSVCDARDWMPDEWFIDQHHLNTAAAIQFTTRLAKELLVPQVNGTPP